MSNQENTAPNTPVQDLFDHRYTKEDLDKYILSAMSAVLSNPYTMQTISAKRAAQGQSAEDPADYVAMVATAYAMATIKCRDAAVEILAVRKNLIDHPYNPSTGPR